MTILATVARPCDGTDMGLTFRPGQSEDFEFCARLYFAGRGEDFDSKPYIEDFRRRWEVDQVRIVVRDETPVGWLQTRVDAASLFIVQLFIDTPFQNQGIGAEVIRRLIDEARERGMPVSLGVVKTNPARHLYARLGFVVTHEDDRKFFMRREIQPLP